MRIRTVIILCGLMLVVAVAWAARGQIGMSTYVPQERVVLQLLVGQRPAKVMVVNGSMARISIAGGPTLGLTPTLNQGSLDLAISAIVTDPTTGGETTQPLDTLHVASKDLVKYDASGVSLEIQWTETIPAGMALSEEPCTMCCVVCGDMMTCACRVEMECGRCCCPARCACNSAGAPAAADPPPKPEAAR
jgi:hypothetical protein